MPATTSGEVCTQYSQCDGQNWNGCTKCPGDQECIPKGGGTLTSLCRDPESRCHIDFCGVTCSGPEADALRLFNRTCAEEQVVTSIAEQTIPNFCQDTVRKLLHSEARVSAVFRGSHAIGSLPVCPQLMAILCLPRSSLVRISGSLSPAPQTIEQLRAEALRKCLRSKPG